MLKQIQSCFMAFLGFLKRQGILITQIYGTGAFFFILWVCIRLLYGMNHCRDSAFEGRSAFRKWEEKEGIALCLEDAIVLTGLL